MNQILILGAGRSSGSLINYLLQQAKLFKWQITVGDFSEAAAIERLGQDPAGKAIRFDINDDLASRPAIAAADVIISVLPAHYHIMVARYCLMLRKHLLTASYVTDEMMSLHDEARQNNLLFMNECGLDPGIDHMSAMQVIDQIKSRNGKLVSFESFTGGLIAPETDPQNPWRYKFTWNPRNVVMAGQSTARFLQEGEFKYIPYQQLFSRTTNVTVEGIEYEGYANRDSLKYLDTYGLSGIQTMLRGTLRNKGFCSAWNILVQLGCCDDQLVMENVSQLTHRTFLDSFLDFHPHASVSEKIITKFKLEPHGEEIRRLSWSGLFSNERVDLKLGTPAQVLEHILSKKWKLSPGEKDFVVMWHRFVFEQDGMKKEIQAHLTATGENEIETAMSRAVGLPLGIVASLLLQGKIASRGVVIPVMREVYDPVLKALGKLGISLQERETGQVIS
ncbi:MAG: saccharopine dehydrogenase C-terminal domain-containing protein [Chryseolinea sp.]